MPIESAKEIIAVSGGESAMMTRIVVQVLSDDPARPVAGHTLELRCDDLRTGDGNLSPLCVVRPLDASGKLVLDIANDGISADARFRFQVLAPNGLPVPVRGPASAAFAEILALDPVTLAITPGTVATLAPAPTLATTRALKGRVVYRAGGPVKQQQVILYATALAAGGAEDPRLSTTISRGAAARPLAAVTTDSTGSFRAVVPNSAFASASAVVACAPSQSLGIPLEADGRLPGFALLVVDAEPAEDADCGCADATPRLPGQEELTSPESVYTQDIGGSCVNFTVPNRSVEEFAFHGIVRTTDPDGELMPLEPDGFSWSGSAGDAAGYREFLLRTMRRPLDYNHRLNWDATADRKRQLYQATTLAHGHILVFKQSYKADGYSLGDLLYSLPLAPGQKKQIVIYDWNRSESASREEEQRVEERLDASIARDRDLDEIVSGVLTEKLKGKSRAGQVGASGGYGKGGGSFAVSGGAAFAASSQQGSRSLLASSHQQLRDRTLQSASAVRSQRATVVTTASQGETMTAQTDVVANHNHCHALTMQYFEVLRHFVVEQELADVQECLFVPLPISAFDDAKILRWRDTLSVGMRAPTSEIRALRGASTRSSARRAATPAPASPPAPTPTSR